MKSVKHVSTILMVCVVLSCLTSDVVRAQADASRKASNHVDKSELAVQSLSYRPGCHQHFQIGCVLPREWPGSEPVNL